MNIVRSIKTLAFVKRRMLRFMKKRRAKKSKSFVQLLNTKDQKKFKAFLNTKKDYKHILDLPKSVSK